jgi:hypothetical protein
VWNNLWQGSEHNPTLQFQHWNIIWVNTKHHFALGTCKSFSGLSSVDQTPHCWGQWLLFCTLNQLVVGSSLWDDFRSKHPSTPSNPMDYRCIRLRLSCQFSVCVYVSFFHCHFQVPCFSLKAFPKMCKVKVVPVLFSTQHHAMEAYWGSGGIVPLILWPWH